MIYQGETLSVSYLENGIAELRFDAPGSVNKLDRATLLSLSEAIAALQQQADLKGLILTSGKDAFIVGADITEFLELFDLPQEDLLGWLKKANDIFSAIEDLPVPTLSAIKGHALGGGCETILSTDFRLAGTTAKIGLPETKLGIMPGFGGTVRLPRVIGADNALEWITTGKDYRADDALKVGAIDAVVAPEALQGAAVQMIKDAIKGKLDWQGRRAAKKAPLRLSKLEAMMSFTTAAGMVAAVAGKHYPAPMTAVKTVEAAAGMGRDEALAVEEGLEDGVPADDLLALEGMDEVTAYALASHGVRTGEDLSDLAADEILEFGIEDLDQERAAALILAARAEEIARLERGE